MKRFIFGLGLFAVGLSSSVASANAYYGDCCPTDCNPCCEAAFDGFYFGGNLGVLTNVAYRKDFDGFTEGGCRTNVDTDFTIGLQVGYDWNCGCSLFGLVFDWNWVNVDNNHHAFNGERHHNENDWFLTIRGRSGVTVCDCLFYITLGAAAADFETKWRNDLSSFRHSDTRWGWVGGAGVEYLLGCNFSLGLEFLSMQFATEHYDHRTPGTSGQRFLFGDADSIYVGRVLLNYRLGDLCGCFCR